MNAVVASITHHQGVVIIHAHPSWTTELSTLNAFTTFALFAQCLNQAEGLTRIKDLDYMGWWTTRDMQVTMQIHTQPSCSTTDLEVEEVLMAITTPHRDALVFVISCT